MDFLAGLNLLYIFFQNYYFPNNSTSAGNSSETLNTTTITTEILPESPTTPFPTLGTVKPTYGSSGLIFGTGGEIPVWVEGYFGSTGSGYGIGNNGLTLIATTPMDLESSEEQYETFYKRWECLWQESSCEQPLAKKYCTKGCIVKYSTGSSKCFDGCCRCLVFTSEMPTNASLPYYI